MALALAIVSFLVPNTLLVEAASKGIAPIIGDVRFSLALALPYAFRYVPRMVEYLNQADG
jgi:hypothetical protein